jgi:PAS domain S-box-containing protein
MDRAPCGGPQQRRRWRRRRRTGGVERELGEPQIQWKRFDVAAPSLRSNLIVAVPPRSGLVLVTAHDDDRRARMVDAVKQTKQNPDTSDVRACADDDSAAASRMRARQMANGVEESMISVLIADDDAPYAEANAAICALTGYSRAELLAMTIGDLTPEHRVGHDRRLWERFKRAGRSEGSYRIRRRSGESATIRCASSANVAPGLHVATLAPPRLLEVIRS